jgi:hypothetical protein
MAGFVLSSVALEMGSALLTLKNLGSSLNSLCLYVGVSAA